MSNRNWLFLVVLLILPVLTLAADPNVQLKDPEGKVHNISEYIGQGKWTIVMIWSADCPICQRDIYHMTFFQDEHHKKDATVLGVSIDGYVNRAKVQSFINDQSLNFPNLIGDPEDASRISNMAFIGTPTYYFFSPKGDFMTQRVGPMTQQQAEEVIRNLEKAHQSAKKS
ncbi:MAG: TlpA family protein disulfide reductase [Sulfuricaulis sp.]